MYKLNLKKKKMRVLLSELNEIADDDVKREK